jgi:hypothetical protein
MLTLSSGLRRSGLRRAFGSLLIAGSALTAAACSGSTPASTAQPLPKLYGYYAPQGAGTVALIEFTDDTHYMLWRDTSVACVATASDPNTCAETGTYHLSSNTLTLTDSSNGNATSFAFQALSSANALMPAAADVHPLDTGSSLYGSGSGSSQGSGGNLTPGGGSSLDQGGGSLYATQIQLSGPAGAQQLAWDGYEVLYCGNSAGLILTVQRNCGSPVPLCRDGSTPGGPIGQGIPCRLQG